MRRVHSLRSVRVGATAWRLVLLWGRASFACPCVPLAWQAPPLTHGSTVALPQLPLQIGGTLGYVPPHVSLPLPFSPVSGRPIWGSWHIRSRLEGWEEAWVLREGWCNLIGGHSCINRGIEEFLSAWWNWLCMNGPSFPPEMGHFPHVSMNMTTSPAIWV